MVDQAKFCPHCKQDRQEENPSGFCSHLDYPNNCAKCQRIWVELNKFRIIRNQAKEDYNRIVKPAFAEYYRVKEKIISDEGEQKA